MAKTFASGGSKYSVDSFGVIHQEDAQPFTYNKDYAATYDLPEYREKSLALSTLRLGWVLGSFGAVFDRPVASLVDVGYGNGAFLKEACRVIGLTDGKDVCAVDVPVGSTKVEDPNGYDVATFWDSLEHHKDLEFLRSLSCHMLAVSVPWCHEAGGSWFERWKHRKPDEHLHHFSWRSLRDFMDEMGWNHVSQGHHEDMIRVPDGVFPNILSVTFVRKGVGRKDAK